MSLAQLTPSGGKKSYFRLRAPFLRSFLSLFPAIFVSSSLIQRPFTLSVFCYSAVTETIDGAITQWRRAFGAFGRVKYALKLNFIRVS